MKNKIQLNRQDIHKILNVLDKFPEINHFWLEVENSGIGNAINLEFDLVVAEARGTFNIEISGAGDW